MMKIDIKHNFAAVEAKVRGMQEDIGKRALASAMNKSIEQARTQMTREIAGEFNVTAGFVRERLRIRRASARRGLRLEAELIGGRSDRRRSMNIIHFVERSTTLAAARRRAKAGTLKQLFVKIKRKGAARPLEGAFIGNKGRTVFERVPDKQMASRAGPLNKHTQAIAPVQVIDVAQMFNTRRINRVVVAKLVAEFPRIFDSEARYFIQRFNQK